jgi:microcystin-dependent protein
MTAQFLGEIKMVGFNFAPTRFAFCNGALIAINQNTALFSLLGTFYGGNGTTTFALPNMQGRFPMHQGTGLGLSTRTIGEEAGVESVSILTSNMPAHNHIATATSPAQSTAGTSGTPGPGLVPATSTARDRMYGSSPDTTMAGPNVATQLTGQSLPLEIMPPYLVVNFIIALQGIFPARN